jgi:hypothetical protein
LLKLIAKLTEKYPVLRYTAGEQFYWSPENQEIIYNQAARGKKAVWSLLHESGHALLGHTNFRADYELLRLEVAAWDKAKLLANELNLTIDDGHIEDCLDTYRDWLYRRSLCPNCNNKSLQQGDFVHYRCFNCHTIWKVNSDRFARTYRSTKKIKQALPTFT